MQCKYLNYIFLIKKKIKKLWKIIQRVQKVVNKWTKIFYM